jgi:hypothetical protein
MSAKGSGLLLKPASAAFLIVNYTFTLEATTKILKDMVVLVMLDT